MWDVEKEERVWRWILWSVVEVYEIPFTGIIQSKSEFDFTGTSQFKSSQLTVTAVKDCCGLSVSISLKNPNQTNHHMLSPIVYIGAPSLGDLFRAMMRLYFSFSSANVRVIRGIWKS